LWAKEKLVDSVVVAVVVAAVAVIVVVVASVFVDVAAVEFVALIWEIRSESTAEVPC